MKLSEAGHLPIGRIREGTKRAVAIPALSTEISTAKLNNPIYIGLRDYSEEYSVHFVGNHGHGFKSRLSRGCLSLGRGIE